ncbi:MAG: nicotinamide riboside transporter PnuC [Gemmatimonadetes bacterium]|nr:nicotinamide riboside transporter PnuC [Gemmatimonadota bacterium]
MTSLAGLADIPALDATCAWLTAHGSSCAEAAGFVTGVLNVWLVTRESVWAWPLGVLNAVFYMVVFARTGLYSDTGLQGVYFTLSLYGWWHWLRGGTDHAPVVVTRTTRRTWTWVSAVAVTTWITLALITQRIPGAKLPFLDAALVAISLVAQWMMTRKLLENWLLWIAVDVVYVGVFVSRGLPLTAVLYAVFLGLATLGYVQWRRSTSHLPPASSSLPPAS